MGIAVTLATLESELHEVNSIKSGIKLYDAGKAAFKEREDGVYFARIKDRNDFRSVILKFTRDGAYFDSHYCTCGIGSSGESLCKHIVAAVLAIQGGVIESDITPGKTASVTAYVQDDNTAAAMGSGNLAVFATPAMISLMERAACECLSGGMEAGQTSVGTEIGVSHTAASPLGALITATATIEYVFGRRVEFSIAARDENKEIGRGKHSRVIVDEAGFMAKLKRRVI